MSNITRSVKVTLKAFRFNKDTDYLPHYDSYEMDVKQDELMLDVMKRIKEIDGSFTYRRSCRHGVCGSCAIKVNGKATLACKDRVHDLVDLFGHELIIDPQSKQRAFKDLVIDKKDYWTKYDSVQPYVVANIDKKPNVENIVSKEEVELLDESDACIQCGSCYYSCPVIEVNPKFIGPAALLNAFRFNTDVRDNASAQRLEFLQEHGSGIWDCVKCLECSQACPKDLDPIGKITKLHLQSFEQGLAKNNVATRHAVAYKWSIKKHGLLNKPELLRYSEGNIGVLKHLPTAITMYKREKLVMPWNMPKSKNHDEIQKLIEIASTTKF